MEITVEQAMKVIKKAMEDDSPSESGSYAHTWHCNIAMMCNDAMRHNCASNKPLVSHSDYHRVSNDAASRFMKLCFNVETKN